MRTIFSLGCPGESGQTQGLDIDSEFSAEVGHLEFQNTLGPSAEPTFFLLNNPGNSTQCT